MSLLVIIHFSFLFSLLSHTGSMGTGSQEPSTWTCCVSSAVSCPLPLSVLCCWTISWSSTLLCLWKPVLSEVAHPNFRGFSATVWELTHLSSWVPASLRQETVSKHRVWDEHTAACFYSYRHACLSDTDNWIFIHIFAWEIRGTVCKGIDPAFQGLAQIPSAFKMSASGSFPDSDCTQSGYGWRFEQKVNYK